MEVQLTEDQQAFVQQGIESGRYVSEQEAIKEALAMWEERERRRAEILAAIDIAEASYARGEGTVISSYEESVQLAEEIKKRGRLRLAAEAGKR
jgi:putative addiction module CopG family antidote